MSESIKLYTAYVAVVDDRTKEPLLHMTTFNLPESKLREEFFKLIDRSEFNSVGEYRWRYFFNRTKLFGNEGSMIRFQGENYSAIVVCTYAENRELVE